jgi:hypothetical protein
MFVAFKRALRHTPDSQASSGLNRCFDGSQGRLFASAARDEQNVVALKCEVRFLSGENVFNIHGQLFTLIGVAFQP